MFLKTPILFFVKDAYCQTFKNLPVILRLCLPLLVLSLLTFIGDILCIYFVAGNKDILFMTLSEWGDEAAPQLVTLLLFIPTVIYITKAQILLFRFFITGPESALSENRLKMSVRERQYFYKTLLYTFIIALAGIVGATLSFLIGKLVIMPFSAQEMSTIIDDIILSITSFPIDILTLLTAPALTVIFFISAGIFFTCAFMMRFVLYFPAKATGYYISFRESFSLFKGWALRTTLASVLAMLPFFIFTEVFRYGIHCLGAFLTEGLGQSVYIVFLQVFNAVDYVLLSSFVPMTVFLTVIQSRVYIEIIQKKRNLTLDEMRLHLDN